MRIAALIVAAGRGTRAAGSGAGPKQYALIGGRPVLAHTIAAFAAHPEVDEVKVVIHNDDGELYAAAAGQVKKLSPPVMGGATRQNSVRNGLEALAASAPDLVLIHDAARPFVSATTISNVIDRLKTERAVLAALPVTDTLKRASDKGVVADTIPRAGLCARRLPRDFTSHQSAMRIATRQNNVSTNSPTTLPLPNGLAST